MNKHHEPTTTEQWHLKQKRERRYSREDVLKLRKII